MKFVGVIAAVLAALAVVHGASKGLGMRIECLQGKERFESRIYENKIKELIEQLRVNLTNGIPEQNIPPMDPLVLDNTRIQIDQDLLKIDWNMTKGQIAGLMGFNITNVKFNIAGFKFEFGFSWDSIHGQGEYGIDGLAGGVIPVFGTGTFDVEGKGLTIDIKGKLGTKDKHLFMEQFSFEVHLNEFIFQVTGLMDDEDLNKLLSQMLSDSVPSLIEDFQPEIDTFVSDLAITEANKILANLTIDDILGMIKPKEAAELYYLNCL